MHLALWQVVHQLLGATWCNLVQLGTVLKLFRESSPKMRIQHDSTSKWGWLTHINKLNGRPRSSTVDHGRLRDVGAAMEEDDDQVGRVDQGPAKIVQGTNSEKFDQTCGSMCGRSIVIAGMSLLKRPQNLENHHHIRNRCRKRKVSKVRSPPVAEPECRTCP